MEPHHVQTVILTAQLGTQGRPSGPGSWLPVLFWALFYKDKPQDGWSIEHGREEVAALGGEACWQWGHEQEMGKL